MLVAANQNFTLKPLLSINAVLCYNTFDGIRGTARRTPQYIRSTAVYCGKLYCVGESRSGVNRLKMQSMLQICFQILGNKD